jgi:hypothetical protein
MAIRLNGQDFGPIKFTDDRPGKTIHIGPFLLLPMAMFGLTPTPKITQVKIFYKL